ncbi:MAG: hypothetical protein Q9182_005303 [Xanthomendoza sp. 2 TL-2023]
MEDLSQPTSELAFTASDEDAWPSGEPIPPRMKEFPTAHEIKQERRSDRNLIVLQQRLRDAAKASMQSRAVQPQSETKPVPLREVAKPSLDGMAALHPDRQHLLAPQAGSSRPINEQVKIDCLPDWSPRTAVDTHQQVPLQDLPQVGPGQRNLHHVELFLASLNRELRTVSKTPSSEKQETLLWMRNQAHGILQQLRAEHSHSRTAATTSNNQDQQRHKGADRNNPRGRSIKSVDRYIPPPRPATSVNGHVSATADNYTPYYSNPYTTTSSHYTPSYPDRETTTTSKRQREPSAERDTEVIADIITQVTRLTRKVAALGVSRPEKRRRGAAEGLSVALVMTVEDLLAKAKQAAGYAGDGGARR